MSKKVVIVGGVAGGASVAARIRRLDESAQIIMLEKGHDVSFSNCCLPFHLSGMIENSSSLVLMNPTVFKNQYNIEARTLNQVMSINREAKSVVVKDLKTNVEYVETYDVLFLSPGAYPIKPQIEGIDHKNVFTVRNVQDVEAIMEHLKTVDVKRVSVIGGGFIGMECAENLKEAKYDVTLVEAADQVMAPFDYDMVQVLHKEMLDHGVNLVLNDGIVAIADDNITLQSGKQIACEIVIMAIGVKPETSLAKAAGLELGVTGAIKVDRNYVTSDPYIYAVGDAIEVWDHFTGKKTRLTLAGPAQKQARAAANHLYGKSSRNHGVFYSSSVKMFTTNAASTGLNEKMIQAAGYDYDFVYIIPGDKVGLMPNSKPMHFKLLFEKTSGKILGAQAIGLGNVDKRIDVVAALLLKNGTIYDLEDVELTYSPHFGTAKDVLNFAGLVATNIMDGVFKQVKVSEVRSLVESNAMIIDVREPHEYEAGHLVTAVNIPLSEFRNRMDEIPRDCPVYLHCRSSQRSYNALMALIHNGYTNCYNMSGSYLGFSCYEYANDVLLDRKPIFTNYNFK